MTDAVCKPTAIVHALAMLNSKTTKNRKLFLEEFYRFFAIVVAEFPFESNVRDLITLQTAEFALPGRGGSTE